MPADIAFSFNALTPAARRHIRVFQVHQFLDRFAMGLTVAVVALALTDRGMDLAQISLLFGVYAVTTMALELPFGGLADALGRKPVYLSAVGASLVSLALFLSSDGFGGLALSFAFIGFGRALRSGTLDAWFLETFRVAAPGVDVQPALARAHWANAMGLAVGAVAGGLLPDVFGALALRHGVGVYDVSYVASFGVMLGVLAYALVAIAEPPRPTSPGALWRGFARVPALVTEAAGLALRHPTLSLLLAALALVLMATNPVEVLWPTHLRPMLDGAFGNTAIGALTAAYFFAIAFGAALSPRISRLVRRRQSVALMLVTGGLAAGQVALALHGSVAGFIGVFLVYSILLGALETPASTILHRCVQDRQRSTTLSLRSLIQQMGAAIWLVIAGAVAEAWSTPVAWILGGLFLAAALVLTGVLARRLSDEAG
jgi:MFS family permease